LEPTGKGSAGVASAAMLLLLQCPADNVVLDVTAELVLN
jgi:hypothetical protein